MSPGRFRSPKLKTCGLGCSRRRAHRGHRPVLLRPARAGPGARHPRTSRRPLAEATRAIDGGVTLNRGCGGRLTRWPAWGSRTLFRASAVIQQALDEAGLGMTVVGGSAVTVWRPDDWSSGDIDFVGAAASAQVAEVLEGKFGFERDGRGGRGRGRRPSLDGSVEPKPAGLENRQWSSRSLVGSNPTPAADRAESRVVERIVRSQSCRTDRERSFA